MSHFRNIGNIDHRDQIRCRRRPSRILLISTIFLIAVTEQITLAQNKPKGAAAVRIDERGRKFVNQIPFDVFFENPLELVNSNKNSVAAPQTLIGKSNEPKPPITESTPPAKVGRILWHELLTMEELQSEIKSIRNSLTKSMSNPGSYNANFKTIAIDGAEFAALAGIVQEHTEPISWKDKAQYVRDFGAQLNQSAIGLGKDNFDKTRSAFQKLTSVLDGSIPPDAGEIPETRPFHEAASRKGLMKRIEKAKDWLKQDVNSEAKFKSMASQVRHEAAVISALATVITTAGYEYTEDVDYQQHARSLIEGAQEASSASQDEVYDRFKQAVDKVNKSCTDCHATYGNG